MILASPERIGEFTARGWWGDRRIHDDAVKWAARRAAATALVDPPNRAELMGSGPPRRLAWQEVEAETAALAAWLVRQGIGRDDIVLVQLPNTVELPLLYLAAFRIGAVVSPLPVQYREHEIDHIAALLRPRLVVTAERILKHRHGEMMRAAAARHGGPAVLCLDSDLPRDWRDLGPGIAPDPAVVANDVATICWTSGTEGVPKGVPRSHNEWLMIPDTIVMSAGLGEGAVLLNPFPLVNMGGLSGQFLPWLATGGKLVMHHPFSLDLCLAQMRDEAVEYSVVAPAILNMLAQNADLLRGLSLRALGSGGGALSEWAVRELQERHGLPVINYFGSNEGAALTAAPQDVPDPARRATHFPRFGVPGLSWFLPSSTRVRTRLVDPDTGEEVRTPGRPGELRAKGPAIFSGYFRAPDLTARAFDDEGWYRSGDLFEIAGDDERFYRFVGRAKDIIVRGGQNISSEEVENLLMGHPAIAEAAAVAMPDERLGERVCAVVATRGGAALTLAELVQWLRDEKRVAAYKLPERLVIVPALPRNPVGKVLKRELRQIVATERAA